MPARTPYHSYRFTVQTPGELNSLYWLGARYLSAELLLDSLQIPDIEAYPIIGELREHEAWEVLDATEEDGGYRGQVPCLGGRLGDDIHAMLAEVI